MSTSDNKLEDLQNTISRTTTTIPVPAIVSDTIDVRASQGDSSRTDSSPAETKPVELSVDPPGMYMPFINLFEIIF